MFTQRQAMWGLQRIDPAMVVRGWVSFSPVPATILGSHNVTSVSRASAGHYTVTWSQAAVASAYTQVVALSAQDNASGITHPSFDGTASVEPLQTTSSLILLESSTSDGVTDTQLMTVVLIGPR